MSAIGREARQPILTLFASAQTAGAVEEVLAAYRSVRFVRKP